MVTEIFALQSFQLEIYIALAGTSRAFVLQREPVRRLAWAGCVEKMSRYVSFF